MAEERDRASEVQERTTCGDNGEVLKRPKKEDSDDLERDCALKADDDPRNDDFVNDNGLGKEGGLGKESDLVKDSDFIKDGDGEDKDDLRNVSTFEDLMQLVGTRGRWNLLVFLLCAYSAYVSPHQTLSYQFLGATPDYWCHVSPLVEANWTQEQVLSFAIPFNNETGKYEHCHQYNYNYSEVAALGYEGAVSAGLVPLPNTSTVFCNSRDFNLTQYESTVTIEWDLVCERRVLYSTTQAAVQAGKFVGYLIHGYLLDRYGRRPVVLWSAVLCGVSGFLAAAAPNVELYICLLIAISCMTSGCYMGCFVLLMETCSTKERSKVGTLFVVPWALGYMVVPGIAYLVRIWRQLQAVLTLPIIPVVAYYWLLPESPRWLIAKGQYSRALDVLRWAARANRKTLPPDHVLLDAIKGMGSVETPEEQKEQASLQSRTVKVVKQYTTLLRVKALRSKTLVVFFCWFGASMVYYGVALNSTNLSANTYIYIFLGGLLEVPSYVLLWPAVVYLGRVKSLSVLFFACALSILLLTALIVFVSHAPVGLMMFLSLMGKMAITAAFHLIWMMTAELFPTMYRSLAVGQASVFARSGSILSPYINDILGELIRWMPSMVFGLVSLVAGVLCLYLPETRGCSLAEDIESPDDGQQKEQSEIPVTEDPENNKQTNRSPSDPSVMKMDTFDSKKPQNGKINPAFWEEAEENSEQANTKL